MFRIPLFLFLIIATHPLSAQFLSADKTQIDFGMVTTGEPDTLEVRIVNFRGFNLNIKDVNIYHGAFSVLDTAFHIAPGSGHTVRVVFDPRHNIKHNTEIVIIPAAGNGGQLAVDIIGTGVYADTYYSATQNLTEEALKQALGNIISSGYKSHSYNDARDQMYMVIDNQKVNGQGASQNTLTRVYIGTDAVGYTSRTDLYQKYSVNAEHTFPQSLFNSNLPMRSDIHHLFPTDVNSNSQRGNLPFGEVNNPQWQQGGSKKGNGKFEPRDAQKGPTARAMMYFVIRYQDYNKFLAGQENVLRKWHMEFLPDDVEQQRNEDIYAYQKNRNPFIDHPEFLERITMLSGHSKEPVKKSLKIATDSIIFNARTSGDTSFYELVLVNDGNVPLHFSNASFSSGGFAVVDLPSIIDPGESSIVTLGHLQQQSTLFSQFTFEANLGGNNTVTIPVRTNATPAVGISQSTVNKTIKVYPNPVRDVLRLGIKKNYRARIIDAQGRMIWNGQLEAGNPAIEVGTFPAGIYLLQLFENQTHFTTRFVIQLD